MRLGHMTSPQRMRAKEIGIFSCRTGVALHDQRDALRMHAALRETAEAIDGTKQWSGRGPRGLEPLFDGDDRAGRGVRAEGQADMSPHSLLINLRRAQMNDSALRAELDVGKKNPDNFRSSERTCKSKQQNTSVASSTKVVAAGRDQFFDVGGNECVFRMLCDALGPPDSPITAATRGWRVLAGENPVQPVARVMDVRRRANVPGASEEARSAR